MKHEVKIEITREGRWWMIVIPEIDGLTQARRLSDAEQMAREFTALHLGVPIGDVKVETASVRVNEPEFAELLERAREVRDLRGQAQRLEAEANNKTHEYCRRLATFGVPVRDIAELVGISPQRVSQLANR